MKGPSQTTFYISTQRHRREKMKACKGIAAGGRKSKSPLKRQSTDSCCRVRTAIAGSILANTDSLPSTLGKTTVVTVEAHTIAKHCQSYFMHPLPKPHS